MNNAAAAAAAAAWAVNQQLQEQQQQLQEQQQQQLQEQQQQLQEQEQTRQRKHVFIQDHPEVQLAQSDWSPGVIRAWEKKSKFEIWINRNKKIIHASGSICINKIVIFG